MGALFLWKLNGLHKLRIRGCVVCPWNSLKPESLLWGSCSELQKGKLSLCQCPVSSHHSPKQVASDSIMAHCLGLLMS